MAQRTSPAPEATPQGLSGSLTHAAHDPSNTGREAEDDGAAAADDRLSRPSSAEPEHQDGNEPHLGTQQVAGLRCRSHDVTKITGTDPTKSSTSIDIGTAHQR